MLQHLSVQNYALIDQLEIDFSGGLTIITGETGAGKSILLGALGLIAGNRSDAQALQDKTKKCVIEATFNIKEYALNSFFDFQELDYEEITTIRREINPEGKSRAFINDTPVTLSQLKELTERLIDIHSQHQTLTLNGSEFQLSVVDAFAQHTDLLKQYSADFKQFKLIEKKLNELLEKELIRTANASADGPGESTRARSRRVPAMRQRGNFPVVDPAFRGGPRCGPTTGCPGSSNGVAITAEC